MAVDSVYAHHNQDHINIQIDTDLTPPDSYNYLWWVFGPVVVIGLVGLVRALMRHRRKS